MCPGCAPHRGPAPRHRPESPAPHPASARWPGRRSGRGSPLGVGRWGEPSASNWSEPLTMPGVCAPSALSAPRWVVAIVRAPRRVSSRSAAAASAAPSAGSVPLPISSIRMRRGAVRLFQDAAKGGEVGAERGKVRRDRLMVADVGRQALERRQDAAFADGGRDFRSAPAPPPGPTVFSSTVLPPVLGPLMRRVRSASASARSNGTTGTPRPSSRGCRAARRSIPPPTGASAGTTACTTARSGPGRAGRRAPRTSRGHRAGAPHGGGAAR